MARRVCITLGSIGRRMISTDVVTLHEFYNKSACSTYHCVRALLAKPILLFRGHQRCAPKARRFLLKIMQLLALMFLGLFLSMWISNHTSPILCFAIIEPFFYDFGSDSKYTKCLLLGLAFACNFGGMMTPISSMQNALAVQNLLNQAHLEIEFGRWLLVSIPVCTILTVGCWFLLITIY